MTISGAPESNSPFPQKFFIHIVSAGIFGFLIVRLFVIETSEPELFTLFHEFVVQVQTLFRLAQNGIRSAFLLQRA